MLNSRMMCNETGVAGLDGAIFHRKVRTHHENVMLGHAAITHHAAPQAVLDMRQKPPGGNSIGSEHVGLKQLWAAGVCGLAKVVVGTSLIGCKAWYGRKYNMWSAQC